MASLHDALVRHVIDLGRHSNHLTRQLVGLLNQVESDLVAQIARVDPESASRERLESLLADTRRMIAAGYAGISSQLDLFLRDLGEVEAEFGVKVITMGAKAGGLEVALGPTPTPEQVMAAVRARPFQGRLLSEWLTEASEGTQRRVRDQIRIGFVEGEGVDKIVRRVRGTKAMNYSDGAMEISRRGAEAMVRTAVSHTSSVAHQQVFEANSDIITGRRWISTLDSRTTLTCISLSGRVFPLDSGPWPPAHIGCRSTVTPEISGMDMTKIIDQPSYPEWLKRQPESVQRDILGPTRWKLWRDGKLELQQFTDSRNNVLTLDQLRARNAAAFSA